MVSSRSVGEDRRAVRPRERDMHGVPFPRIDQAGVALKERIGVIRQPPLRPALHRFP